MPHKEPKREYKVGEKIRVNLYRGQIDDAIVRALIQQIDGTKLQVDVIGLDLTALMIRGTRGVFYCRASMTIAAKRATRGPSARASPQEAG